MIHIDEPSTKLEPQGRRLAVAGVPLERHVIFHLLQRVKMERTKSSVICISYKYLRYLALQLLSENDKFSSYC